MNRPTDRTRPSPPRARFALLALAVLAAVAALPAPALAALPLDLGTLPTQRLAGPAPSNGASIGAGLAGDCDVNADGRDDLVVGAPQRSPAGTTPAPGGAFVVFGGATNLEGALPLTGDVGLGTHAPQTGTAIACGGDVNGDDLDDIVIGAPEFAPLGGSQTRTGVVYVVFGATDLDDLAGLDLANLGSRGFTILGPPGATAGGRFGNTVSILDDLTGDGSSEVGASAFTLNNGAVTNAGVVFVVAGRAATTTVDLATPGATLLQAGGGTSADQLEEVVTIGDLTGDDVSELAVGARSHDSLGRTNNGAVFVLDGAAARGALTLGPAPTYPAPVRFVVHGTAGETAGVNLAAPGDVNGDGDPDLLVGSNVGAVGQDAYASVVFGAASTDDVDLGALGSRGYRIRGAADAVFAARFTAVGGAGDVDGDGKADLLLGQSALRQATLLYGKATTGEQALSALDATQGARLTNATTSLGSNVVVAGDVDDNGVDDLAFSGGTSAFGFVDVVLLPAATPDPGPGSGGGEVENLVDWGIRANLRSYVYNGSSAPGFVPGVTAPPITVLDGAVCYPNPAVAIGGCDPRVRPGGTGPYPSALKWTPSGAELDLPGDKAVVATRGRVVFSYPAHCFTITVVDPRWTLEGTEAKVSVRLIQDVIEGCSAVGAPGEVASADSDQRVTLATFRIAARTVRDHSVTWATEAGRLTDEGQRVLSLLPVGSELDPATVTVPRSIGGLPELDPRPGGTQTVTVPGATVVRTVTTPGPAAPPAPKATAKSLTGAVRGAKTGKRKVTVTLSRVVGARADRVYRVWLTSRGRSVATGTLEGRTLTLSVTGKRSVVGKGRQRRVRTTYPRLKGSYTLRPASGGTNLPTVLVRLG